MFTTFLLNLGAVLGRYSEAPGPGTQYRVVHVAKDCPCLACRDFREVHGDNLDDVSVSRTEAYLHNNCLRRLKSSGDVIMACKDNCWLCRPTRRCLDCSLEKPCERLECRIRGNLRCQETVDKARLWMEWKGQVEQLSAFQVRIHVL